MSKPTREWVEDWLANNDRVQRAMKQGPHLAELHAWDGTKQDRIAALLRYALAAAPLLDACDRLSAYHRRDCGQSVAGPNHPGHCTCGIDQVKTLSSALKASQPWESA